MRWRSSLAWVLVGAVAGIWLWQRWDRGLLYRYLVRPRRRARAAWVRRATSMARATQAPTWRMARRLGRDVVEATRGLLGTARDRVAAIQQR